MSNQDDPIAHTANDDRAGRKMQDQEPGANASNLQFAMVRKAASSQPRGDLKSTALTSVSWNAMNPFGAKDLTALPATLSSAGPPVREALSATAQRGRRRTFGISPVFDSSKPERCGRRAALPGVRQDLCTPEKCFVGRCWGNEARLVTVSWRAPRDCKLIKGLDLIKIGS